MTSRQLIDEFLAQQHVAVVGVSRDPKKFSNVVYRRLRDGGRTVYAVNSDADTVEGVHAYPSLADVPDPVDGVIVVLRAEPAKQVVRDAVARGIPRVWLQRGLGPSAVSEEAVATCREHGVSVVDGACPLMYDEPVRGIHRVHRALTRNKATR